MKSMVHNISRVIHIYSKPWKQSNQSRWVKRRILVTISGVTEDAPDLLQWKQSLQASTKLNSTSWKSCLVSSWCHHGYLNWYFAETESRFEKKNPKACVTNSYLCVVTKSSDNWLNPNIQLECKRRNSIYWLEIRCQMFSSTQRCQELREVTTFVSLAWIKVFPWTRN